MEVTWSPEALQDMEELHAYIAQQSGPTRAHPVAERIAAAIGRLQMFPLSAPAGVLPGTRELLVPRTSYRVVYRVFTEEVYIVAVRHTARQWPPATDDV